MIKSKGTSKAKLISKILVYLFLAIAAFLILVPFYVILITALKRSNALATATPFIWFPKFADLSFRAFKNLFTTYTVNVTGQSLILTGTLNTLAVLVPCLIAGMFCSSVSAYAFAKLRFPFKNVFYWALLASMMLPGIVLLTPQYLIYDYLGLVNTLFPIMVPGMFGSAACVFFLRQYFSKVPDSIIEAAKIDGLHFFSIYWYVMLPLSVPGLIAQSVLGFIAILNDYIGPLIYLQTEDKYTLQIALQMFSGGNSDDLPVIMAGALFAMLPSFLVYAVAKNYFFEGIAFSGLK
ncbi:MAG: carbohydrate ABC transporter permease [Clostridia bacterium]|nr:carbohydrate ABC transporter permease [Clostridia bacterium]